MPKTPLLLALLLPVVFLLAGCSVNSLIYPRGVSSAVMPAGWAVDRAKAVGLVPWERTTTGASGPQGYVPVNFAAPAPRGTIVVFHGNGAWAGSRTVYVDAFTRRGFRVFLYEYPGYGGRPGMPSEASIVPDARAVIRSLDQEGFGPIYVWGESLGAGVAAAVCADGSLPVHGLALLTPWDNLTNVGKADFPMLPGPKLTKDRYDSVVNLEHFAHPICVIRSENDWVIPPRLSLNLYAHLPEPKRMILHKNCGHIDWPHAPNLTWWDEALDFIAPR